MAEIKRTGTRYGGIAYLVERPEALADARREHWQAVENSTTEPRTN